MRSEKCRTQVNQPWFIAVIFAGADIALINLVFWSLADSFSDEHFSILLDTSLIMSTCWVFVSCCLSIYDADHLIDRDIFTRRTCLALCFHVLVSTFILYIIEYHVNRVFLLKFFILFFVLILAVRSLYSGYLKYLNRSGYCYRSLVIIGSGKEAVCLKNYLNSDKSFGVKYLGYVSPDKKSGKMNYEERLGDLENLEEIILRKNPNEIYWTLPLNYKNQLKDVIRLCEKNMIHFHAIPNYLGYPFKNLNIFYYGGLPVMHFRREPLELSYNRRVKRLFDFLFSSMVILLVLSWVVPIVGLMIKSTSKGPVFFLQKRTGRHNQVFKIIKFRTMTMNSNSDSLQASKEDARVTKLGALLRKSSIDELPQFFNSFVGNMSVVGPRPHMLQHTEKYAELIEPFMVRHEVKSGITGWAQVNGARGETEVLEKMEKRVALDVEYLENWSLFLDIKVCALTIWTVLFKRDQAY